MISQVPLDFLVDLLYDKIMEGLDPEQRDKLEELLHVPLGLTPEQTDSAKAERASIFGQLQAQYREEEGGEA